MIMLSALKSLFTAPKDTAPGPALADEETSIRIAFTALLVEAARSDENYDEKERALITTIIRNQFSLTEPDAIALREQGEAAQGDAIDLHRFTKQVKTLPEAERVAFIEGLWRIVLSDGVRDPFEDTMIRRVCGLVHLTDRVSGEARQRVEGEG